MLWVLLQVVSCWLYAWFPEQPQALEIDQFKNVYILDRATYGVYKYNRDGKLTEELTNDRFLDIQDIEINGLRLILLDRTRLYFYDLFFAPLSSIAIPEEIIAPSRLAVLPDGYYFLDREQNQLFRLSAQATRFQQITPWQGQPLTDIEGGDNQLFVLTKESHILKYSSGGNFITSFGPFGGKGLCMDYSHPFLVVGTGDSLFLFRQENDSLVTEKILEHNLGEDLKDIAIADSTIYLLADSIYTRPFVVKSRKKR